MSKEYIERNAAIAALKGLPFQWDVEDLAVYEAIEEVPTADVAPVIHGKWSLENDEEMPNFMFKLVICSACSEKANHTYNYCPNCGTKMDGGNG